MSDRDAVIVGDRTNIPPWKVPLGKTRIHALLWQMSQVCCTTDRKKFARLSANFTTFGL